MGCDFDSRRRSGQHAEKSDGRCPLALIILSISLLLGACQGEGAPTGEDEPRSGAAEHTAPDDPTSPDEALYAAAIEGAIPNEEYAAALRATNYLIEAAPERGPSHSDTAEAFPHARHGDVTEVGHGHLNRCKGHAVARDFPGAAPARVVDKRFNAEEISARHRATSIDIAVVGVLDIAPAQFEPVREDVDALAFAGENHRVIARHVAALLTAGTGRA